MRVRILSGNQAGQVQDVGEVQGEVMIQTGYAERVVVQAPAPPVMAPSPPPPGPALVAPVPNNNDRIRAAHAARVARPA